MAPNKQLKLLICLSRKQRPGRMIPTWGKSNGLSYHQRVRSGCQTIWKHYLHGNGRLSMALDLCKGDQVRSFCMFCILIKLG